MKASAVNSLGEIALRVNDLQQMLRFYQDVLGLEVLGAFSNAALLKVADGYGGHTQVLGLFDRSVPVRAEHTTVDHSPSLSRLRTLNPNGGVWRAWG
jgi:catechol-2,3-dioxygenase